MYTQLDNPQVAKTTGHSPHTCNKQLMTLVSFQSCIASLSLGQTARSGYPRLVLLLVVMCDNILVLKSISAHTSMIKHILQDTARSSLPGESLVHGQLLYNTSTSTYVQYVGIILHDSHEPIRYFSSIYEPIITLLGQKHWSIGDAPPLAVRG